MCPVCAGETLASPTRRPPRRSSATSRGGSRPGTAQPDQAGARRAVRDARSWPRRRGTGFDLLAWVLPLVGILGGRRRGRGCSRGAGPAVAKSRVRRSPRAAARPGARGAGRRRARALRWLEPRSRSRSSRASSRSLRRASCRSCPATSRRSRRSRSTGSGSAGRRGASWSRASRSRSASRGLRRCSGAAAAAIGGVLDKQRRRRSPASCSSCSGWRSGAAALAGADGRARHARGERGGSGSRALLGGAFAVCAAPCVGHGARGDPRRSRATRTPSCAASILLAAYSLGIAAAFVFVGIAFTRAMARVPLGARPLHVIRVASGATSSRSALLLFFDRDWWLNVATPPSPRLGRARAVLGRLRRPRASARSRGPTEQYSLTRSRAAAPIRRRSSGSAEPARAPLSSRPRRRSGRGSR